MKQSVMDMKFHSLFATVECCLERHVWILDRNYDEWKIDMIHILKGSAYDGYFERIAERIKAVLPSENRRTILELKYTTPGTEKIMGVQYFHAIIGGGVRTRNKFTALNPFSP